MNTVIIVLTLLIITHIVPLHINLQVGLKFRCSNYFSVYSASNLLVLLNDSILRKDLRWISSLVSDQQGH